MMSTFVQLNVNHEFRFIYHTARRTHPLGCKNGSSWKPYQLIIRTAKNNLTTFLPCGE